MSRHPEGGGTGRGVSAAAPGAPRFQVCRAPPPCAGLPASAARGSGAPGRDTPSAAAVLVVPTPRDGSHAPGQPLLRGAREPAALGAEPTPPHAPLPVDPAGRPRAAPTHAERGGTAAPPPAPASGWRRGAGKGRGPRFPAAGREHGSVGKS